MCGSVVCLLIVPYGIETSLILSPYKRLPLLIVPYGIETIVRKQRLVKVIKLLIVPYGIETIEILGMKIALVSFNRTLWN